MFDKFRGQKLSDDLLEGVAGGMLTRPKNDERIFSFETPEHKRYRTCSGCSLSVVPDPEGKCPFCGKPLGRPDADLI